MMTDPIADLLTRIRNALMMHHEQVAAPYSRFREAVLKILKQEGFIRDYEIVGEKHKKMAAIHLKYAATGQPAIGALRRVSKPGRRVFIGYDSLKPLRHGMGVRLLSTSKGVMSDHEAIRQKLGGEILLEVW